MVCRGAENLAHVRVNVNSMPTSTQSAEREQLSSAFAGFGAWAVDAPDRLLEAWAGYVGLERKTPEERWRQVSRAEFDAVTGQEARQRLLQRLAWLERGTSAEQLASLDPQQDGDRILHHVFNSFRAEGRVLETAAINRIAQSTDLLVLIRSTKKAETQPVLRYFDTYGLLSNFFEWGLDTQRGAQAVKRICDIHGRYFIPNEGMKYILLQTAFTWIDGADRIAHRPLLPVERGGVFHAYVNLGLQMGIAELSHDYDRMYAWYADYNRRHATHHPIKQDTFERILGNSLRTLPDPLRGVIRLAVRTAMDDEFRQAVGEPAVTPAQLEAVRVLLAAVNDRWPPPSQRWIRSLMDVPGRQLPPPSQLGSSERHEAMPRLPSLQAGTDTAPLPSRAGAIDRAALPVFSHAEVARHRSPGDLWVIIDGDVFDLSTLVEAHPGGRGVLMEHAGADASDAYRRAAHPATVETLRANYLIGRVDAARD